jgi:DNA-binding MarR family transcriptional regulator
MPDLNELNDLDRVIHEPARLMLTAMLSAVEQADFTFLMNQSGLTRGNLSSHLARLEEAGYVGIEKGFRGKYPQTLVRLTPAGRAAFDEYRRRMKSIV